MSFFDNINFATTILTFGCVSFAASNFGIKLGKLASFSNTSGYKYISESDPKVIDKLYDATVKVSKKDPKAPDWAKDLKKLKNWCNNYQNSLRYWEKTFKYCLIQNTARHKLIEAGIDLKNLEDNSSNGQCTEDILDAYADTGESLGFLLGKKYCSVTASSSSAK